MWRSCAGQGRGKGKEAANYSPRPEARAEQAPLGGSRANACLQSGVAAGMVMLARAQGLDCYVQPSRMKYENRHSGCCAGTMRTRTGAISAGLAARTSAADTRRRQHLHEASIS